MALRQFQWVVWLFWHLRSIVIFTGEIFKCFLVFSFPSEYQFHFPASANPLYLIEILFHSVSGVPTQMLQTCLFPKGVIYNYNTEKEPALHFC